MDELLNRVKSICSVLLSKYQADKIRDAEVKANLATLAATADAKTIAQLQAQVKALGLIVRKLVK
jgi:hypothetical protein